MLDSATVEAQAGEATPRRAATVGRVAIPSPTSPYDAVILLSFGGPEAPEEVIPFLRRVTAGRGIPDERLEEVATHYFSRGGVSPINAQNRALVAALESALAVKLREADSSPRGSEGVDTRGAPTGLPARVPVVLANRNSEPFLAPVLRQLADQGVRRACVITTSGYSSYSSCRQYRENLAAAVAEADRPGLVLDKVEPWFGHPGFVETMTESTLAAVMSAVRSRPGDTAVLFVTHSIPTAMDETSGPGDEDGHAYSTQHLAVAGHVMSRLHADASADLRGELVFCSRSGRPGQPWLEPDIGDRIRELAQEGVQEVVVVPIGFASDHMEVIQDLDTVAAGIAAELGLGFHRVSTVGTAPAFVDGLVDLLLARAARARGEDASADFVVDAAHPKSICPSGCCPNLRTAAPALCGEAP